METEESEPEKPQVRKGRSEEESEPEKPQVRKGRPKKVVIEPHEN
jgi:hypothetical protein